MADKSRNSADSPLSKCSWKTVTPENQTAPGVNRSKCKKVVKSTDRPVMKYEDKMLFDHRTGRGER